MAYFESVHASPFARKTSTSEKERIKKRMKAEDAAKLRQAQKSAKTLRVGDTVRNTLDPDYVATVTEISGNQIKVSNDRRFYSAGVWEKVDREEKPLK
ncbi:hypothetical protein COU17_02290 [Candidatus Kaiserbacteria bacterium CG10_big_fil_rev_8_21_14_0_10_49_17]|uniref:Uncharacterized protein n=1 Tax=Candidatus Kaiserbacteria bacterium CG10_big_fil_rev_8_21_14_0_10_49_17 TaxID=1974609 RepID=A0A2M6WE90_9BACT|nr:MAG: hypothetical protein COU17_02290 [Candidatus Kaiserbacteria bacterium CG10_big_fil_rev_8_21_14_0_10_49_17]